MGAMSSRFEWKKNFNYYDESIPYAQKCARTHTHTQRKINKSTLTINHCTKSVIFTIACHVYVWQMRLFNVSIQQMDLYWQWIAFFIVCTTLYSNLYLGLVYLTNYKLQLLSTMQSFAIIYIYFLCTCVWATVK